MSEEAENIAQTVRKITELSMEKVIEIEGTPAILLRAGTQLEDLSAFMNKPKRQTARHSFQDAESFCRYVNAEKTDKGTVLFADIQNSMFRTIFDYDGWKDHVATYACPLSDEWKIWAGMNGKKMGQQEFAQFIEDNLPDISNPPGATMLEMSRSFEAKKNVQFASSMRMTDGSLQFSYTEDVKGSASKGMISIPDQFTLYIPVFLNGANSLLDARFRYRIDAGQLAIWYDLVRPNKVRQEAFESVRREVDRETDTKSLLVVLS